eukprot:scaffold41189_cov57-Attheya_sp.AAC.1
MENSKHDGDYGHGKGSTTCAHVTSSRSQRKCPFCGKHHGHTATRAADCDNNPLFIKASASSSAQLEAAQEPDDCHMMASTSALHTSPARKQIFEIAEKMPSFLWQKGHSTTRAADCGKSPLSIKARASSSSQSEPVIKEPDEDVCRVDDFVSIASHGKVSSLMSPPPAPIVTKHSSVMEMVEILPTYFAVKGEAGHLKAIVTNGGVQLEAAGSQAHCQCAHHRVFRPMLCGGFLFWRLRFYTKTQYKLSRLVN